MRVEILFPEYCNLFGDVGNVRYLKLCAPDAEYFETNFCTEPAFVSQDMNLIYMGPCTERMQEKIIAKLLPLKNRIRELIAQGTVFLFTGNAMEITGQYLENEDGSQIKALGLFDFYVKRDMMHRHSGFVLGDFHGQEFAGFRAQFTKAYELAPCEHFLKVLRGEGINDHSPYEGFVQKNFFATYLLGPILVLNPDFTLEILRRAGEANPQIAFEEDVREALRRRLKEFHDPHVAVH